MDWLVPFDGRILSAPSALAAVVEGGNFVKVVKLAARPPGND
jgi:hypothetical protein